MILEPFIEFRRLLNPYLRDLAIASPQAVLSSVYRLAKRTVELEYLKEKYEKQSKDVRTSRLAHSRVRAHLGNALKSLAKARAASDDPELLNNLDMVTVETLIKEAVADLGFVEEHLFPAMIHPELRIGPEKRTTFKFADNFLELPGFGVAQVEYWFIAELEKYLRTCTTKSGSGLTPDNINQIIAKCFESAFSQAGYKVSRVKTARRRIHERQAMISEVKIQN